MDAYRALVLAHSLFGLVALLTFWTAGLTRKGGAVHRGAGRLYLSSMIGIVATALPIAVAFYRRGDHGMATFLLYLVVITATAMWLGWRAIRRKSDQAGFRDRAYLAVAVFNLAAAVVVFVIGLRMPSTLLMGFSAIGLVNAVQMGARRIRPSAARNWWLKEHYSAMLGCGAATHVAFLSLGLSRLLQAAGIASPGWYGLLAWALPVVASVATVRWLDRCHGAGVRTAARRVDMPAVARAR